MEKQYITALVEKASLNGGDTFSFIASTAAIDRQGDSIDQSGWDVSDFLKNPVMLWAHDYTAPPVAKALTVNPLDPRGLVGTCEFAPTDFAQEIKTLVEGGFVNALSVGFIPEQRNGNVITKSQLLEISFVPVPANQEALMLAYKALESKGFAEAAIKSFMDNFYKKQEDDEENEDVEIPSEEEEVIDDEPAEDVEEKGAVSDEIDAEAMYEQKWNNLDAVWDILGAFCDVYLDDATPVNSFNALLLEVASLITTLAQGDGGEDENAAQTAALAKLVKKTVSPEMRKLFIAKIGATHSAATTKALQSAMEHTDAASAVLKGLVDPTSIEDDTTTDDEPTDDEGEKGIDAGRVLLTVRGVLRERTSTDQKALGVISRFLEARNQII